MRTTALVVPCFNEAERLNADAFVGAARDDLHFLFVDDGSSDDTRAVLTRLCARDPERLRMLVLERNSGKAEAVRRGLVALEQHPYEVVGFWDADLATPLNEVDRLATAMEEGGACVALGARVVLLGHRIRRKTVRHLLGRTFATAASWIVALPVYDTQCGAKLFRVTDHLRALLSEPFQTKWTFDVEILAHMRLQERHDGGPRLESSIVECPLREWTDVAGSKVKLRHFITAIWDLGRIARLCRRRGGEKRVRRRQASPSA